MKIDLSKINKKDIEKLLLEKEMNIAAAQSLFDYCFYTRDNPCNNNDVLDYLELNLSNKEDKYFYESRIKPSIKKIDVDDYKDNYYRNHIKPKEYKDKKYQLTYLKMNPYQCFPYDDILIDENYVEVSQIGYFDREFPYLAVLKDDVVWMSTDPNEINTMDSSIKKAKGRVLAFGLGLGYFPIMCASKKEVTSVVVVEKDPEIIKIFKKHILPLFEHKEKITIIQDDAFNYADKDLDNMYDYLYIDIWHNPEDGLMMYLRFKSLLKNKKLPIDYWLEKSILAMYRRCMLTVIEESLMGFTDKDYQKIKNDYDLIIANLYYRTKNKVFTSIKEIKEILQSISLVKLI